MTESCFIELQERIWATLSNTHEGSHNMRTKPKSQTLDVHSVATPLFLFYQEYFDFSDISPLLCALIQHKMHPPDKPLRIQGTRLFFVLFCFVFTLIMVVIFLMSGLEMGIWSKSSQWNIINLYREYFRELSLALREWRVIDQEGNRGDSSAPLFSWTHWTHSYTWSNSLGAA